MVNYKQLVKIDVRKIESLQFEASFSYKLSKQEENIGVIEPKNYRVQTFIVLPSQFQASPKHYGVDNFYRDLKSYFSFQFPKLSFKELMGQNVETDVSPLNRIEEYLSNFMNTHLSPDERNHIFQEAKLWSCSVFYFTDRKVNKLRKLLDNQKEIIDVEASNDLIEENINRVVAILRRWTETKNKILVYAAESVFDVAQIDEYIASVLREFVLKQLDILWTSEHNPYFNRSCKRLSAQLRLLRWYTKKNGYLWVDDYSSLDEKQEFSYRRSALKRSIWSALYIETRSKSLFKLRRQTGAMVAAGFAGSWYIFAEILIWRSNTDFRSLGASGFIIMTALVLAYILKDRIKELGKDQFRKGLFGQVPDNNSHLLYNLGETFKKPVDVGTYSEKTSYSDSKNLPDDIRRRLAQTLDLTENHVHVICYEKTISLRKKKIRRLNLKIKGLYDFFRLNLASLMFYAEESDDMCRIPTHDLTVAWASLPKIYKVDLVLKVSGESKPSMDPHFHHYQMLVSRQGIHSINPIDLEGDVDLRD